jgi:hypothetical protein
MPQALPSLLGLVTIALPPMPARADQSGQDLFRARVAPVLEARCIRCHGGATTKGGLSLRTAEAIRAGGENGPPVEPGKPAESLLLEMVAGEKPAMPRGGPPLDATEVAALRAWIEQGAHWPEGLVLRERSAELWWAIQPLARPAVPEVKGCGWVRTPVDAFILAALEARGLAPRPEADRRTLIRRLTFDLLGLPPTPEEVERFVSDDRPDAYERVVDRLLASPHYGERWGRHWLDVVHYGDTHGYDKDKRRDHAWPYRDYVIRAFNEDKPHDTFLREQIAGDVISPGDPQSTIATGFLAAGPWDFVGHVELREGTVEKEKTRLIDRDDILSNAMSTFVSLTVHCARCHDHKFDPIPQRDYYRLQAVFAGLDRGNRPFPDPTLADRRRTLQVRRDAAFGRLEKVSKQAESLSSPELARIDSELESSRHQLAALPRPLSHAGSPTNGYHSTIRPEPDAAAWVQVDLGASVPIDEVRLVPARPTDFPDTPGFGFPAKLRVELSDDPMLDSAVVIADDVRPDHMNHDDTPEILRPGGRRARFVRVAASRLWKRSNDYVFALSELEVISGGRNVALGASVSALDSIEAGRWGVKALIDGYDSRSRRPDATDADAARWHELAFRIRQAKRERQRLADTLVSPTLRSDLDRARAEVATIDAEIKALPTAGMVYAVLPREPRPIRVLRRGDVEQAGEPVGPGALSCVPGLGHDFASALRGPEGGRRAALAEWLTDKRNVLTWRSAVNRIWQYHFGRGLVETPNDFGRNGARPSHPELLDWLAAEFRDGGRSWKALHRLIVTSSAYRQSSAHDAASAAIDAENRYLWRMARHRLEAEEVRDAVLAAAGTLDPHMGGPGFEPFRFKDDHSPIYDHEAIDRINSPECRRRVVYRFIVRSVPNPFLDCLDGADPNANTPVRNTTITALQALTLRNDPFVIAQSEAFADRLRALGGDRIDAAYRLALGRPPRREEREAWSAFAERRGLAAACRLLFNLNEFVFVD